jgi:hypothetical protein
MPHRPRTLALLTGLALLLFGAAGGLLRPAAADDGDGSGQMNEVSRKVREQMQKIIQLMQENEKALLRLSTGQGGRPGHPEVVPPEGTQPPPGGTGSAAAGGEEAQKALGELIRGQRQGAEQIPHELEELVRMVPQ